MNLKDLSILILLGVFIILIGSVRFNRNDFGISNLTVPDSSYDPIKSNDAIRYINMTDYYKGTEDPEILIPPYTTRVLVPFIASKLPFATDTSINIINFAAMIFSLFILYYTLVFYKLPTRFIYSGCFLYVFSFPTFYYGTVTYVDAVLLFFLFLSFYFMLTGRIFYLIISLMLGTCVKESMILLIPVFFVNSLLRKDKLSLVFLKTFTLLIIYFLTIYFLHMIKPNNLSYLWIPSYEVFISNVIRPRTFASFILTFGIPGILSSFFIYYFFIKDKSFLKINLTLISGLFISFCLWSYSVISAYSDGRFIWPSIVFSLPMSMIFLKHFLSKKYSGSKL